MRSATIITLFSAGLTVASPLHQLFHAKKALVTEMVTDVVTVYITATDGAPALAEPTSVVAQPTVAAQPKKEHVHTHHTSVEVPASSSAAPPPPPPAPTTTTVAAPTTQPAPAPPVSVAAPSSSAAAPSSVAAPPSSAAAAPASSPTDYSSTAVFNHNQHRANHSASDMAWNQTLADFAAVSAAKCVFKHDNDGYGQNIAAFGASNGVPEASNALANAITESWYYGEVGKFPFNTASPPMTVNGVEVMHFSQVVWKNSQTVGCATHQCPSGSVLGGDYDSMYTVCNYYPAGNVLTEFIQQVSPPNDKVKALSAKIVV